MTSDEATTICTGLAAAFPAASVPEETAEVWREFLAKRDFEIADKAVAKCILELKWFPAIAEFREFYNMMRPRQQALSGDRAERSTEVPEWVHIWRWNLDRTRSDRQIQNEAAHPKQKVEDRPPRKMRDFPQFASPGPDVLSQAEFEAVRQAWRDAGEPRIGDPSEAIAV